MKFIDEHIRQLAENNNQILILPNKDGFDLIRSYDISYIVAARAYCTLYFYNGNSLLVSKPLKEIESQLLKKRFFRVHNSYLVNICSIHKVIKNDGEMLELHDGKHIPLAQRRREAFFRFVATRK
ncbi:MAG: LytTR family transcriptional regulator [Saprospiraceae bacterium]|nr:LytTR family transcriptional regulator [Saprospiraceae bacterium]